MAAEFDDVQNKVYVDSKDKNYVYVEEVVSRVEVAIGGPQGAQGEIGPTGATGATGPQGPKGTYTVSDTAPASPSIGDTWFNSTTAQMYLRYDGYWVETSTSYLGPTGATGAQGPALNPTSESYSPVWSGTGLTYTGTPATGKYIKIGKLVHFRINVACTNVTNFGTGQYSLTLPFAPVEDYVFRDGGFHDVSTGNHHAIAADAESGTTTITLWHPGSSAKDIAFDHNTPLTAQTADYFYLSGTYEAQ